MVAIFPLEANQCDLFPIPINHATAFDGLVAKSPWLAGAAISAADIVVFPWIPSLLRAAAKEEAKPLDLGFLPLDARYPHLAAWVSRIEAIPGYERTYPPHWK